MSVNNALVDACRKGDFAAVETTITQGADVNCLVDDMTPLMSAALKGYVATIRFLVSKGADVNKTNVNGFTALRDAAQEGFAHIAKTLVEYGANIDKRGIDGGTAIFIAAQGGHDETVAKLVQLGADATAALPSGSSPISIAAFNNHPHCVHALVDSIAARDGSAAALELLRAGLRNLETYKCDDACILLTSIQNDFVRRLMRVNTLIANVASGKRLDVKQLPAFADFVRWRGDETGDTLLHRAVTSGDNQTVAALLALPKSATLLQHANVAGRVPLLEAHRCDNMFAVDLFAKFGAGASAQIGRGLTGEQAFEDEVLAFHDSIKHGVLLHESGIGAIVDEATTTALDERLRQQQMTLRDGAFDDRAALDAAIGERDATRQKLLRQADVLEQAIKASKVDLFALRRTIKTRASSPSSATASATSAPDDVNALKKHQKALAIWVKMHSQEMALLSERMSAVVDCKINVKESSSRAAMAKRNAAEAVLAAEMIESSDAVRQLDAPSLDADVLRRVAGALLTKIDTLLAHCDDEKRRAAISGAPTSRPDDKRFAVAQRMLDSACATMTVKAQAWQAADDDEDVPIDEYNKARAELRTATFAAAAARRVVDRELWTLVAASLHYPELPLLYPRPELVHSIATGGAERQRELRHYVGYMPLAFNGHRRVHSVKFGGRYCVLKEYRLADAEQLATFRKEIGRLRAWPQHAGLAAIEAMFIGEATPNGERYMAGYIQMPLYEGYDLARWVTTDEDINDARKQLVLRTALQGLMFVHEQGIVHADVKPANIFVTREGTGVLGDFDVSQNAETRATMASLAATRAVVGLTWDYAAPESVSTPATKASDMFSFGLTMFDLHFRPTRDEKTGALRYRRPTLSELVRGATIDVPAYANKAVATTLAPLLRSLLALDATTRATASAALAAAYFVQPLGATIGARDAAKDRRECIVAYEQFWRDEGVECDGGHFLSRDALVDYVRTLARDAVGKHNGFVRCPAHQCKHRFDGQLLARHLSSDDYAAFVRMQRGALEVELQRQYDECLKQELEAAERVKDTDAHRKHIVEQLLTLQCPRCSQAFVDFEGCFALTCGRCCATFCAWCLVDCGDKARRHVARCRHNRAPERALYGTNDDFERIQTRRRELAVPLYILSMPESSRAELAQTCVDDWRKATLNP